MLDVNTTLEQIEKEYEEVTTKELEAYGMNAYYRKKAIEQGRLKRICKGHYKVIQKRAYFVNFQKNVFKNKFEEAYKELYSCYEVQFNHDYDNHMRCYFLLLKALLGEEQYDFSFVDNLYEFSEEIGNENGYYQYFVKFRYALMESNYKDAHTYIGSYRQLEKQRNGYNHISTNIFYHLANCVYNKYKREQKMVEGHTSETRKPKLVMRKKEETLSRKYYFDFVKAYREGNLESAIENLKKVKEHIYYKNQENCQNFLKLITLYMDMQKDDTIQLSDATVCIDSNKTCVDAFKEALKLEDYLTALEAVKVCIEQIPNSDTLKLYYEMLEKLCIQNEENKKIRENKELKEWQQEFEANGIHFILDLIYNQEYEKVERILKSNLNENCNERVYFNIIKMIEEIKKLKMNQGSYRSAPREEVLQSPDMMKHFFEALRCRDYETAYSYVGECEERAQINNRNVLEFTVYRYLLEEIVGMIQNNNDIERLEKQLEKIIENYLDDDALEQLKTLLQEKISIDTESRKIKYDAYALEIMDMIQQVKQEKISKDYMMQFQYSTTNLLDKLENSLQMGDYVTASQTIYDENWLEETKLQPYSIKTYFIMFRRLFLQLKRIWDRGENKILNSSTEIALETDNTDLMNLSHLKTLLKKQNYIEAYWYYQTNPMEGISLEAKEVFELGFTFNKNIQEQQFSELLQNYETSFRRGDFVAASNYLKQYEEILTRIASNQKLDHYFARIASLEKDCNTAGFVKREQLYDMAKYQYSQENYNESLNVLEHYISMNQNMSAKGYLLRGKCCEKLGNLEEAKISYESAISIIPEPEAFESLGNVLRKMGQNEEALNCYLEYEIRNPYKSISNITSIKDIYQFSNDVDQVKKYSKIQNVLKQGE